MSLSGMNAVIDFEAINSLPQQLIELKTLVLSLKEHFSNAKQTPIERNELLSSKDAAKYLDISISHLYFLTHAKQIPFYKPNGKRVYFRKPELDLWISETKRQSHSELDKRAADFVSQNQGN